MVTSKLTMKTNTLIATINTCIDRLNTVKNVLEKESDIIENNLSVFLAVRHFIDTIAHSVMFYSSQFIKNENI